MGTLAEMLSTPLGVIEWFVYLLAAVMFVIGLHLMNSPKTARKGNMVSAIGMVFAVAMAFIVLFAGEASNGFKHGVAVIVLIVGIVIGAVAGVVSAKKVKMTDMPQLVSVFNTVGGGAAALVALNDILTSAETPSIVVLITAGLGIMIGSVTFSGSLIAAGKLQGIKWVKKLSLPGKGFWNILFVVLTIVSFVMLCVQPNQRLLWSILTTVFALCYGLVFVIPIGGADMPVVISVLNACTGTAVAMSGLAINNIALIVAGALVGAAGVTLSIAMSKAMNRPLLSVLAGGFGGSNSAAGAGEGLEGTMKETSADDLAVQLVYAEKVIFVPGFGLAQAQAQRELADLGTLLKDHGVEVSYAVRGAHRPGRHQPAVPAGQRGPCGRRQRRDQPGRAQAGHPGFRHADPRRRQGTERGGHEAWPWHRLRRHPERAVLRRQHADALRRRQGQPAGCHRSRQGTHQLTDRLVAYAKIRPFLFLEEGPFVIAQVVHRQVWGCG